MKTTISASSYHANLLILLENSHLFCTSRNFNWFHCISVRPGICDIHVLHCTYYIIHVRDNLSLMHVQSLKVAQKISLSGSFSFLFVLISCTSAYMFWFFFVCVCSCALKAVRPDTVLLTLKYRPKITVRQCFSWSSVSTNRNMCHYHIFSMFPSLTLSLERGTEVSAAEIQAVSWWPFGPTAHLQTGCFMWLQR